MIDENTPISADDGESRSPAARKPYIDNAQFKRTAETTWRSVWGFIGVLATVGGVLGLLQFVGLTPFSSKAPTAETLLVAMVTEGMISEAQASDLSNILSGELNDLGDDGADLVKIAIEEKDTETIIAMARMLNSETYQEGFGLLEAAAETSEDWLLLAELSHSKDPARAVEAAKKAVRLDPQNFRAVTLLVHVQAAAGDYATARRSIEMARMTASTPLERLMADATAVNIAIMGGDKSLIETNHAQLVRQIEAFAPVASGHKLDGVIVDKAIDTHPVWAMAFARMIKGDAELRTERGELALKSYRESERQLMRLEAYADEEALIGILRRKTMLLESIANANAYIGNEEEAYTAYENAIAAWEDLALRGEASAVESEALAWASYGKVAFNAGDKERALMAYTRGAEALEALSKKSLDNEELRAAAVQARQIVSFVEADKSGSGVDQAAVLSEVETSAKALIGNVDDAAMRQQYLGTLRTSFMLVVSDMESAKTAVYAIAQNAEQTADAIENQLGPNYHPYMLRMTAVSLTANFEKTAGNTERAKQDFLKMRDLIDIIGASSGVENMVEEYPGMSVNSLKLGALLALATLEDEDALRFARSGKTLSSALDDAGQLSTQDQFYLQQFNTIVAAAEVPAD